MAATRHRRLPTIRAWHSPFGLVEEYEYPPGPAGAMSIHAHRDIQICFSVDFPGRYLYRGRQRDVPVGAVSILDSWEPHAASDPFDRDRLSHYLVMYVDPDLVRSAAETSGQASIADPIRTDPALVGRFHAFYRALTSSVLPLERDARFGAFVRTAVWRGGPAPAVRPSEAALLRARDYIAAHAREPIRLRQVAAQAGLSASHLVHAFRRRFGGTPHRFQLWMRLDEARRLLARGMAGAEVAHRTGFADQSHFARWFKRVTDTTPGRYRGAAGPRPFSVVR